MEEVDSILLSQLRDIGCDLDEEIKGISSLDSYQIMQCVSICLEKIISDPKIKESIPDPTKMPSTMNMSIKYKLANQLSTCIKDIGYKSDIGYQTFLYSNEHEIRRLFLFLVEQISNYADYDDKINDDNDQSKWLMDGDVLTRLKKFKLNNVWLPYSFSDNQNDYDDYEDDSDDDLKYCPDSDYYDNYPTKLNLNAIYGMKNYGFKINSLLQNKKSSIDKFCRYKLKQKQNVSIIPEKIIDILEWNNNFWEKNLGNNDDDENDIKISSSNDFFQTYLKHCQTQEVNPIEFFDSGTSLKNPNINLDDNDDLIGTINDDDPLKTIEKSDDLNKSSPNDDDNDEENQKEERQKKILQTLQNQLDEYEKQILQLKSDENELIELDKLYQDKCKLFEANYKTKEELENGIENIKSSIEEIASTWDEIQKDLLIKLKEKKLKYKNENEEQMEKIKLIKELKLSITQKLKEIQSKNFLINELESRKPEQWPPGRQLYTRRIIEIINNVKKQNDETKKVLLDIKTIQKEINNLNGKIERSFLISEEILFLEAKQNEWNKQCYKSLVLLKSTFNELLHSISEIGIFLRDIRKLEEMIESEQNRKTRSNLTRINADLEQIRLENRQLKEKLRQQQQNDQKSSKPEPE